MRRSTAPLVGTSISVISPVFGFTLATLSERLSANHTQLSPSIAIPYGLTFDFMAIPAGTGYSETFFVAGSRCTMAFELISVAHMVPSGWNRMVFRFLRDPSAPPSGKNVNAFVVG